MNVTFKFENGAMISISKTDAPYIVNSITIKQIIWIKKFIGRRVIKKEKQVPKRLWAYKTKERLFFWRGHLPRILADLKKSNTSYSFTGKTDTQPTTKPELINITLRKDQVDLLNNAIKYKRGVIKAPTGSGKSIIMAALISSYSTSRCLVVAHLSDLVRQLKDDMQTLTGETTQQLTSQNPKSNTRISVVSIQTLNRMDTEDYYKDYDVVIVDESHHVSSQTGMYAKVLSAMQTPHRYGFTATLPYIPLAKMSLEGFIGRVVGELTINQAVDLDILAKPKLKLIKIPHDQDIKEITKYKDAYYYGIVRHRVRNTRVIEEAYNFYKQKKPTLILVHHTEHGLYLQEIAKKYKMNIPYVYQKTKKEDRIKIKNDLINEKILTVIVGNAWREGINIPNLGAVINACGGKSEISVLQGIGRGLRKTDKKDEVIIVDFFDPSSKWLANHFAERLCLYFEMGWMGVD